MFEMLQVEFLVLDEGQNATGSSDNNMGARGLENFFIFLDGHSPEEDGDLGSGHVLGKSLVFLADLEG